MMEALEPDSRVGCCIWIYHLDLAKLVFSFLCDSSSLSVSSEEECQIPRICVRELALKRCTKYHPFFSAEGNWILCAVHHTWYRYSRTGGSTSLVHELTIQGTKKKTNSRPPMVSATVNRMPSKAGRWSRELSVVSYWQYMLTPVFSGQSQRN